MYKREIILALILIGIAIGRFFFFLPKPDVKYDAVIGKSVAFSGIISDMPDKRITNQRLIIAPTNKNFNILVVTDIYTDFNYGDEIKVTGTLETPENFTTNAGKEFNYKRYLANKNVFYLIRNPNIEIISHNHGNIIKRYLFKLSENFQKKLGYSIPPPESDLASGLLLGARGGFDENARNEFINTGTIHIIALSGYNVTIVANWLMRALRLILSQTISVFFGILVIFMFIIMTGASSTAIRAGIMATIALMAKVSSRNYNAGRILVFAGLLMIAYDSRVITDISFQLSFLATAGILFIMPKIMEFKWMLHVPIKLKMRENLAVTVSAIIATMPILLYSTGVLSFVSIPANILIIPIIPFTMFMAFIAGIVGFISLPFSVIFGMVAYLPLTYILTIIHFFASLPFSSTTVQKFPLFLMILMYVFLIWWIVKKNQK